MEAEWEQFELTGSVEAYLSYRQKDPAGEQAVTDCAEPRESMGVENEGTEAWDRQ